MRCVFTGKLARCLCPAGRTHSTRIHMIVHYMHVQPTESKSGESVLVSSVSGGICSSSSLCSEEPTQCLAISEGVALFC